MFFRLPRWPNIRQRRWSQTPEVLGSNPRRGTNSFDPPTWPNWQRQQVESLSGEGSNPSVGTMVPLHRSAEGPGRFVRLYWQVQVPAHGLLFWQEKLAWLLPPQ